MQINQTRQNDMKEIANLKDEESGHVYFRHHHRQSTDHTALFALLIAQQKPENPKHKAKSTQQKNQMTRSTSI